MNKKLPARPNLDHLKGQAKSLLSQFQKQDPAARQAFADYHPEKPTQPKLADAQFVVARQNGFASWPKLVHYVETLRDMEGTWAFESLEVGGVAMPNGAFSNSQLVINGDRFNMLSPEGDYIGVFDIQISEEPFKIDIDFIEGPEAGNSCEGIFMLDGNSLTICLGLVGETRPTEFATKTGSQHALEVLRRVRSAAPVRTPKDPAASAPAPVAAKGDPKDFEEVTSDMERLQGDWAPLEIVNDGTPLPSNFLPMGIRTCKGSRTTVVFGGQKMVDVFAKAHPDGTIDYLVASGPKQSDLQYGIYRLEGDVLTVCMADSGLPRPTEFTSERGSGHTLTVWKKK